MPKRSRRKSAPAAAYTFTINEWKWTAKRIPDSKFDRAYGDKYTAMTVSNRRIIYFRQNEFSLRTVIHELFHAYSHYLYLQSSSVPHEDAEEIYAEFMEENLFRFARKAKEIYRALK